MMDIQKSYNIIKVYEPTFAEVWKVSQSDNLTFSELAIKFSLNKNDVKYMLETAKRCLRHHDNIEFIAGFNKLASTVYMEKCIWSCTHYDISECANISVSESKQLYKKAKYILNHPETIWVDGLSNRAKHALLKKYTSMQQLLEDIQVEGFDLLTIEGAGEIVKDEVSDWIKNKAVI